MQLFLRLLSLGSLSGMLSLTLANHYDTLSTGLLSRQSSFFCPVQFLQFPTSLDVQCGVGYVMSGCTCCPGGSIGCNSGTQTCSTDASGLAICCDDDSSDCSASTSSGSCASQGLINCGDSCCPGSGYYCCQASDGTFECCGDNVSKGAASANSMKSATSMESATSISHAASNNPVTSVTAGSSAKSAESSAESSAVVTSNPSAATSTSSAASGGTSGAATPLLFEVKSLIMIIVFHLGRGALA